MGDKKTKILYILTKSGIGGAQKYVKDLAENLDKEKFEAKIIYGQTNVKRLSNKTCPWLLFLNDWLAVFELAKTLKQEKPDIIHLNSSKTGVIGALAAAIYNRFKKSKYNRIIRKEENNSDYSDEDSDISDRVKVVFTAHGWVFNPTNKISWLARQFYIFLHKIAAKFQDKIICVSEYDYNLALEYGVCPAEKLAMIHNGIGMNMKFLSKKEARSNLKFKIQNSKLNDKLPWIGSIGRLVKEKDYETFIEAAKFTPNAYFFIIGEGPEYNNLKLKIQDLKLENRFFIIPPSGNDAFYLKAFDVFVMSSVKEGLPYVLLEAMAAGLPAVVTEAGGMPELIKNHENGLMVSQKNPEALARAIGGLLENRVIAKELSAKAKETVREKFNLKMMVNETENIYLKSLRCRES